MAASGAQSIGFDDQAAENKKMLSVLEMDNLSDFLTQAEMASRDFVSEKEQFVVLDPTGSEYKHEPEIIQSGESNNNNSSNADKFLFKELSVPRRPEWDSNTTAQELDQLEKESFLEWRRAIAIKEEEILHYNQSHGIGEKASTTVTPFEKNIEVWKQLWRVLERSQCVIQIVDGRNPLFYLSSDLRTYAESELGKPMLIVVNKCDFLTEKQRMWWHTYFKQHNIEHLFFSAYAEQKKLDEAAQEPRKRQANDDPRLIDEADPDESQTDDVGKNQDGATVDNKIILSEERDELIQKGVKSPLTREELLNALYSFAERKGITPNERYSNRIQFGMVGFPNVGKSSVINVLVGSSKHTHNLVRVGVAAQPGKTKHFQTLILPDRDDMMLCDCPGLVFPSFVSSAADLIAAGVFPIAQMRDHWPVVELICRRIPREILNAQYGITLPKPSFQDLKERGLTGNSKQSDSMALSVSGAATRLPPPTAEELLGTYCIARSILAPGSGVPDYQRASRIFIKDYVDGKLIYCHPPPSTKESSTNASTSDISFHKETLMTAISRIRNLKEKLGIISTLEEEEDEESDDASELDELDGFDDLDVMDDLDLLEMVEGVAKDENGLEVNGGKRGKKHKSMQKWGKKGRKTRNKDPCKFFFPREL